MLLSGRGKTVFSLHQLDSRHFLLPKAHVSYSSTRFDLHKEADPSHSYSYFRVVIARVNEDSEARPNRAGVGVFASDRTDATGHPLPGDPGSPFRPFITEDSLVNENPFFRFIDCQLSSEKNIDFIFEDLDKGEYLVLIEPIWFFDVNQRFNFSVSSPAKSDIIPMGDIPLEGLADIESMIWSDYVMQNQSAISESVASTCLESRVLR